MTRIQQVVLPMGQGEVEHVERTIRFGISMNERLLAQLDQVIERKGYASRSEAIRDLIREYLIEESWQDAEAEVAGTVTLLYDHHVGGLNDVLQELQHDHHAEIASTLHIHLDHDNCLEVIVMRGSSDHLKRLANRLTSLRGVKLARLTLASTGKELP